MELDFFAVKKRTASREKSFSFFWGNLPLFFLFEKKKEKGQVSIEFMLLVLFAIIYIAAVVNPMVTTANSSAEDVSRIGNAKIAVQKIADSIDSVAIAQSSAKQTIQVFVPEKTTIACGDKKIEFASEMDLFKNPKPCIGTTTKNCCTEEKAPEGTVLTCRGEIALASNASINCVLDNGSTIMQGKNLKTIIIEKSNDSEISVTYAQ